jgi:hypothetical protein
MSDTHASTQGAGRPAATYQAHAGAEATAWAGWVLFAAVMMIVLGAFQIVAGLVALLEHHYYLVASSHLVVHVSYTTWGWVHLILGAVIVVVGLGLRTGVMWARILGITLAVVSAIVNLAFIAAYPIWGVLIIALDVVVIYALAVHGREVKAVTDV